MNKLISGLIILGVILPGAAFASCASKGSAYISLGIANYTGYPLKVDMSKSFPDYKSSSAIPSFSVPATGSKNVVWQNHAIHIQTCYEFGPAMSGNPTIKFNFSQADLGQTAPGAKPVLGDVSVPLSYAVSFDSNYKGTHPQITSISLNHAIADEIPGSSPISGIAQIMHAPGSNIAIMDVVFYDLAPGPGGNTHVLKPYQITTNLP